MVRTADAAARYPRHWRSLEANPPGSGGEGHCGNPIFHSGKLLRSPGSHSLQHPILVAELIHTLEKRPSLPSVGGGQGVRMGQVVWAQASGSVRPTLQARR